MIIKMEPNSNSPSSISHAQTRCRSVHARGFTAGQKKNCGKSGFTGPQSRRGSRAVGRGPLGHGPAFSKTRLRFTLSLQSAFHTQSAVYPWSAVCSLKSAVCSPQSAFYTDRLLNGIEEYGFELSLVFFN